MFAEKLGRLMQNMLFGKTKYITVAVSPGEAQQQALRLAVQQARAKAETLADASGLKIASVVSIEEETSAYGGYGSGAIYTNARMDMPAAEASTMVQASSLEVVATVTMEFALAEGE